MKTYCGFTSVLRVAVSLVCSLAALIPSTSVAQTAYPSKTVELIVPYSPGGATDLIARPVAALLEKSLGQAFVVVNKPGASGAIGNRIVANATPDGYTLLVTVVQVSVLPVVDDLYNRPRQYSMEQLEPIARLTADPVVILAGADTPWNSLKELIADAKRRPRGIEFSSGGAYAGNHLPMALLSQEAGIQLLHVPYKGGGPSMRAVLAGEAKVTTQVPGVASPYLSSRQVKALAQSGAKRLPLMADVPTLKELGHDVEFYLWVGMFAPHGTPKGVISKVDEAVQQAMQNPIMVKFAKNRQTELAYLGPKEFSSWLEQDAKKLTEAVKALGRVK